MEWSNSPAPDVLKKKERNDAGGGGVGSSSDATHRLRGGSRNSWDVQFWG